MSVVVQHPSHSSDITGRGYPMQRNKLNTKSMCIVHSDYPLPSRCKEGVYRFIFCLWSKWDYRGKNNTLFPSKKKKPIKRL